MKACPGAIALGPSPTSVADDTAATGYNFDNGSDAELPDVSEEPRWSQLLAAPRQPVSGQPAMGVGADGAAALQLRAAALIPPPLQVMTMLKGAGLEGLPEPGSTNPPPGYGHAVPRANPAPPLLAGEGTDDGTPAPPHPAGTDADDGTPAPPLSADEGAGDGIPATPLTTGDDADGGTPAPPPSAVDGAGRSTRPALREGDYVAAEFYEGEREFGVVIALGVAPARRGEAGVGARLRDGCTSAEVIFRHPALCASADGNSRKWCDFDLSDGHMSFVDRFHETHKVPFKFTDRGEYEAFAAADARGMAQARLRVPPLTPAEIERIRLTPSRARPWYMYG